MLPIDRTQLALVQSNQNPSSVFASSPNKGSLLEAYNTIDELYAFASGLVNRGALSNLGIKNVLDYNASGLATTAVGSIASGTKVLTLTTIPDFESGHGINLEGAKEVSSLKVTAAATVSSNVTVTLNGVAFLVAVVNGDTAIQVATKIRAATFTGWVAGGVAGTDTVTFTSTTSGIKTDATYSAGTTTATGTMTTIMQGTVDQFSIVSSVSGMIVNIADNSTRTIVAGTISHVDTIALQAAVSAASNGIMVIPNGTYLVDGTVGLLVSSNTNILLSPGAVIKVVPNNITHYQIFNLKSVDHVKITGGTLLGERYLHGSTSGEWGYGIYIEGCTNIIIDDMLIQDFWGDGIYLGAAGSLAAGVSDKVSIRNVRSNNNRRQGMSICGATNVYVADSYFTNTNGTAPQAGVDLEPNFAVQRNENITFVKCRFLDNNGVGLLEDVRLSSNIKCFGCTFRGKGDFAIWLKASGFNVFVGCHIYGSIAHVYNSEMIGCSLTRDTTYLVLDFMINMPDDAWFKMTDCDIYAAGSTKFIALSGSTSEVTRKVISNCRFTYDGNTVADTNEMSIITGFVTLSNCDFLHTGSSPATGYYIRLDWADGKTGIVNNCWFDSVYSYFYGTKGRRTRNVGVSGIVNASPTTGTNYVGDIVYNSSPASAGFIGWVCTVAGSPGTWKTFGLIS